MVDKIEAHNTTAYITSGIVREASPLTAELVAAARARRENTPEAQALATFTGHVLANIFLSIAPTPVVNTAQCRELGMNFLVDKYLPNDGKRRVFVDLACGFSSRGAIMARERPDVTVIEIDLPQVIEQKRNRYTARHITLPANHQFISADMQVRTLAEVLKELRADVVMARGLLIYFDHPMIIHAAQNIVTGLKPGGHFIADLVLNTGNNLNPFAPIIKFIRQQTRSDVTRGGVASPPDAEALFHTAGFDLTKAYLFDELADEVEFPKPYNNLMVLVDAAWVG
jgi:O-methyltransferase involved in polyketide biosynthesis